MIFVEATECQNHFDKYLNLAKHGEEIIILKNGKKIARLLSEKKAVSFLTDSLIGVLKGEDCDAKSIRAERLAKYEIEE